MTRTDRTAFTFAVVAEARADRQIAVGLAERVIAGSVDWIDADHLGRLCRWQGLDESSEYLAWTSVSREARARGVQTHGRFRQYPGVFDERRAKMALRLFKILAVSLDGVLLVRDTDGEQGVIDSLERTRSGGRWELEVVLATPHPKRECWVLAGFEPETDDEKAALADLRSELGFDPRDRAHRLTAEGLKGKRNAKTVLARLTSSEGEREERCWLEAAIAILRERGRSSRLATYLDEIEGRLIPLLAGRPSRAGG